MKVFVSSTASDLASYRISLRQTLEQLRQEFVPFEFQMTSGMPRKAIGEALADSDIVVALLGYRHGSIASTAGASWVEAECLAAEAMSKPILVFAARPDKSSPVKADSDAFRLERFRSELASNHLVTYFSSPEDLASRLAAALRRYAATDDEYDDSVPQLWQSVVDLGASGGPQKAGPPLRSTTFKLKQIKELQRKWWTWWTFLLTLCAYVRTRTRLRTRETQARSG